MAKKFPDLTGDGKVTQADVLKGRGVFNEGGLNDIEKVIRIVRGMAMSEEKAETPEEAEKARLLAEENGELPEESKEAAAAAAQQEEEEE